MPLLRDQVKEARLQSKYVGVYHQPYDTRNGRPKVNHRPWYSRIYYQGREVGLGSFHTEREAAIAYDKRVLELKLDRPTNILKAKA